MKPITLVIIVIGVILCLNSVATMFCDKLTADETVTTLKGNIIETVHAFYSSNGELEKIRVYRSTAARAIIITAVTITYPNLEFERHKYGF